MTLPHEPASVAGLVAAGAVALTFLLVLGLALADRCRQAGWRNALVFLSGAVVAALSARKADTEDSGAAAGLLLAPPARVAAPSARPADPASLVPGLRFTSFATSPGGFSYAIERPPTLPSPGGPVDVYATRDLAGGLWSIVETFSASGTHVGALPSAAVPGSGSSVFLRAADRTDADGDEIPDAFADCPERLDSDGDGTPDVVERGVAETLPDADFLWFDLSGGWNTLVDDYWVSLPSDSLLGGVPRNYAQHCRDGFVNLVPDVNWPQGQVSAWSAADSLYATDYSRGGVTAMAMPGNLTGIAALGSGMFADTVVSGGRTYAVFEWKDVWPASEPAATAPRATFEVILPLDGPDAVWVSYLSVDDGFPVLGRRFGVQDASRRSAAAPSRFHAVARLGTADFPRSGQTVRYALGLNSDPHADDAYAVPALPSSANPDAYYTVRVGASAGAARVTFAGDGPSDLPDPCFLLPADGEVAVTLLKGKGYEVSATAPVNVSGPSDPAAEIARTDAEGRAWEIARPLGLALREEADGTASVVSDAFAWGGAFSWTGTCRPQLEADGTWRLRCSACGCGRCEITGTCSWEGYAKEFDLGFCRCEPEGDVPLTAIRCPDTLFNNDDSDRVTNRVDSALGASTAADDDPLKDDDVVPVTVSFGVLHARGSAVLSATGGKLRFWDSREKRNEVLLPKRFDDVELPYTAELWMEATDVSASYEDQSVTLSWQTASGRHSGSVEKKVTCVEPVVEPVCAEEKAVGEDKFIYNPSCLVNDGRGAWFKASWTPEDYPASRVVWSCDNAQVRFLGGNTGAEACVWTTGTAGVGVRLGLQFGDCQSTRPSFGTVIVVQREINILVVPVVKVIGGLESRIDEKVFARASMIFSQAGIRLNVHRDSKPIVFTGVDCIDAEKERTWSVLRNELQAWEGPIVFVVPMINGNSLAFHFGEGERGIVVDPNCSGDLVAHEIGHAMGLDDIYSDSWENPFGKKSLRRVVLRDNVFVRQFSNLIDWNGGSGGRYYAPGFPRAYLIPRLLMCGASVQEGSVDLPFEKVQGVGAPTANAAFFDDVLCPIGCDELFRCNWLREVRDE